MGFFCFFFFGGGGGESGEGDTATQYNVAELHEWVGGGATFSFKEKGGGIGVGV